MSITIDCVCGKTLKSKMENAGKVLQCPSCGQKVTVPWPQKGFNLVDDNDEHHESHEAALLEFEISGVNRETGKKEPALIIAAKSEDDAVRKAQSAGMVITKVRQHYSDHPSPAPSVSDDTTTSDQNTPDVTADKPYAALAGLSEVYAVVGFFNVILSGICVIVGFSQMSTNLTQGWVIVIGSAVYGVIGSLLLFAVAEGITLAIDAVSCLRTIRDNLAEAEPPSN